MRLIIVGGIYPAARPLSCPAACRDGSHYLGKRPGLPAGLVVVPAQQARRRHLSAKLPTQAIYQGVLVVFISMLLYTFAISRLGSHTVALLMAFVPVISALAAVPLLGEPYPCSRWRD